MKTEEIDLPAEIARVQRELTFFREECLPAFLGAPILEYVPKNASDALRDHIFTAAGSLSSWQRTAARLADDLPLGPLPPEATGPSRDDFREFLFQSATPSFTIRAGRIVWGIELFVVGEISLEYCRTLWGDGEPCPITAPEDFARSSGEIKKWLMSKAVDDARLWNALCVVLPAIVNADPAFAKLALDPDTWRSLTLADSSLTAGQRPERLKLINGFFGHVLNNALLHVLGALANNHFLLIEDYLHHPRLRGGYTRLMPHYLFAVLFEKVLILRHLVGGEE